MAQLMEQTAETTVENRRAARTVLSWPVSIWLPEANRFFNGRTVNVAKGGVLLSMPMTTPIKPGHVVEINFPRTMNLAKKKGQFARIKAGKVLRVDRDMITADATIGVAVQFA
ncbi:MAG: PilZ domain-containing protein [Sedimentisphaerales bacterium]